MTHLLIFGLGYTGAAVARAAHAAGHAVTIATRDPGKAAALPPGIAVAEFATAGPAIARATHILATAAPADGADPVLARHEAAIAAAPALRWLGYFSTTGVYGDRAGGWVDEATPPDTTSARSVRRVAAEQGWAALATPRLRTDLLRRTDLFRLAGIYGPGRSPFAPILAGTARRVDKPGHCFGRIHRDDIAAAVLAAMAQTEPHGSRVLNLADDEPAENAAVLEEAARLLGLPPPPLVPFAQALAGMSAMGRSFWADDRKVSSAATQRMLGLAWRYPTYREGLAATLLEERAVE